MADIMDPQAVEERSQIEQENYKVYKKRWLVLFAMFSLTLVVGLNKSLISIVDILQKHIGMDSEQYKLIQQISMYTMLVSVLGMAQLMDYFGLRRIAYAACSMLVCANLLKSLCLASDDYLPTYVRPYRYPTLMLSETFVGFASSIAFCVPPKVANVWFAHYESTLALVIANCGYNVGIGFSNYFTPVFVESTNDMYKLSNMFLVSAIALIFIILTCITRSSPKMPPSLVASVSTIPSVSMSRGLFVMLTTPNYLLLLLVVSANVSINTVEQLVSDEILLSQHYTNAFCGTLIAQAYFFGTFFMLMGAAWVDNSANYVKVSRITSIIFALGFSLFSISIIIPNIKNVILVTNVIASFGSSLMYPALLQVAFRSAATVMSEATVAATSIVLQQIIAALFMNLITPLKTLSPTPDGYQAPMLTFSSVVMFMNFLYATSFRAPSREELRQRLSEDARDIITEEEV